MDGQNSILDKIIQSKQIQQATQFNPTEIISNLFKNISPKERDILNKRFGLFGKEKQTLEQIGKAYEITRERIRQIEVGTIKKLKTLNNFTKQIETAEYNIIHLLENYGGVMEENHLLDELLTYTDFNPINQQASLFIIYNLVDDKIDRVKDDTDLLAGWKLSSIPLDLIKQAARELVHIIEEKKQLIVLEELMEDFKKINFFQDNWEQILKFKLGITQDKNIADEETDKIIFSYLKINKNVEQNILGEWGLASWQTILPKRMSDKAYLVLRKAKKPSHFTEITNLINQAGFDKKIAYPATIHNELILDDRYVLVGRGIYALKEWGYQPGTVLEIIINIIKQANKPLGKEEIIKEVLAQRIVRKSTIYLALTNKEKIKKLPDGNYTLA